MVFIFINLAKQLKVKDNSLENIDSKSLLEKSKDLSNKQLSTQ